MRSSRVLAVACLIFVLSMPAALLGAPNPNTKTVVDRVGDVGEYPSMRLDSAGNPVISYYDISKGNLKVAHCKRPDCRARTITSPDTSGDVGRWSSLALDANGHPIVSYYDASNGDLKILHCNDPDCSGGDESITVPDTGGVFGGNVGFGSSLAIDSDGNPVVSYFDLTNRDLRILHCNDPNCSGGDESITIPDTFPSVNFNDEMVDRTSLRLDVNDYPVVAYFDAWENRDLRVLHCNDPNCSGGNENLTAPDTNGWVGFSPALVLDANGNPIVSYGEFAGTSKILHCYDPNCGGVNNSITTPDPASAGRWFSLALDGSGNPVASYHDLLSGDLKLLHCNDTDCSGSNENISVPDAKGVVGYNGTSLVLDGNGNPIVAYHDATDRNLKLLRCSNINCN